jgi:hypothetical protein
MRGWTELWVWLLLLLIAVGAQGQTIQPTFFGMGVSTSGDKPKVPYGTLAHPPLVWTTVEAGGRGKYDWKAIDGFVMIAPKDAHGVAQIDLVLGWTPGWAVANHSGNCLNNARCTVPPDNLQDWGDFVTAMMQHYNGKTAPHVAWYEIWNEANLVQFWTSSAAALENMGALAAPIIHSDPYSHVATPSVFWGGGTGLTFMAQYLQEGGAAFSDLQTFHGYPSSTGSGQPVPIPWPESPLSTNAAIQTQIAAYRAVADQNGMKGKPLASTEGGWGTTGNGVIDPDQQIAWITHYEIAQATTAATDNLLFQDWFEWGKTAFNGTIETSTGVPTPAGNAYAVVVDWLTGQQIGFLGNANQYWLCGVGQNIVFWDDSQTCGNGVCTTAPFNAPPGFTKYVDVTGATYIISGPIPLGVKPLLLEP